MNLRQQIYFNWVKENAEPWCTRYVEPAFAGDAEAASRLISGLSNSKRGSTVVAMWVCKVDRVAFRAALMDVWEHDHRHLITALGDSRRSLQAMFRYAAFPLPEHLPPIVPLWRGTSALAFEEAAAGYSWTTDRDTACWFAMRFADRNANPLVLRKDVPREAIALYHTERDEDEAVIVRLRLPGVVAHVDGQAAEWAQRHLIAEARNRDRQFRQGLVTQPLIIEPQGRVVSRIVELARAAQLRQLERQAPAARRRR